MEPRAVVEQQRLRWRTGVHGVHHEDDGVLELTPSTEMTYFAHGGRVAIYYRLTLTSRASGQSVEMHVTEVFSVRQGRITELDVFYKSRLRWLLA